MAGRLGSTLDNEVGNFQNRGRKIGHWAAEKNTRRYSRLPEKDRRFKNRSEPINSYIYWYVCICVYEHGITRSNDICL